MSMKVDGSAMAAAEAREALDLVRQSYSTGIPGSRIEVMAAADAYGDARELKGHVEACGRMRFTRNILATPRKQCGDGWYCDKALPMTPTDTPAEIEELVAAATRTAHACDCDPGPEGGTLAWHESRGCSKPRSIAMRESARKRLRDMHLPLPARASAYAKLLETLEYVEAVSNQPHIYQRCAQALAAHQEVGG